MNVLRLMLTTLVLFAQAWPAHALLLLEPQESTSCAMGCCAALEEMECACAEETRQPAAPSGLPPGAGRDLVPQVTWAAASEAALPTPAGAAKDSGSPLMAGLPHAAPPPVRLAVLFCSFLN